jgi:hemerythrin-like domain-containing protein
MNALRMLMSQHDEVEGLLVDLSQAPEREREPLLRAFARALRRHLAVEESVFFPTVAPRLILVKAAPFEADHQEIREALAQAETALGTQEFVARLDTLHEVVVRHISDEEIELFAEVKRRFMLDDLDELGTRLEAAGLGLTAAGEGAAGEPAPPSEAPPAEPQAGEESPTTPEG